MGEESTVPPTSTLVRRRRDTFALVMPVARSLTSLRCGSSPNSGQSRSLWAEGAGEGIAAAPAAGLELSAGALLPQAAIMLPQAAIMAHAASAVRGRERWPMGMRRTL